MILPWYDHGPAAAVAVLAAFAIDALFGEPPARWHPVVWMGRALSAFGAPWPATSPHAAFLRGVAVWGLIAAATAAAALLLDRGIALLSNHDASAGWILLHGLLLGAALKPLMAWRMLRTEVGAVEQALEHGVEAGRDRLRHIVGRDTAELSVTVVRESALESLAENLNDSWVAPLFWFALGGLPAAALYRFANTADAMWGLRGRWEWAGKWAAKTDDALSYLPARATALLLALAAWRWPRGLPQVASVTASPNGGWPMGMLAIALDVRLSRPGFYVLNAEGRAVQAGDVASGLIVASRAAWAATAIAFLTSLAPLP